METWIKIILSIAVSVLLYLLIITILNSSASEQDVVHKRLQTINSRISQVNGAADAELSKPLYDRVLKPFLSSIRTWFLRLRPADQAEAPTNEKLKKQLGQAGFAIGVGEYNAIRIVVAFGMAIFCLIIGTLLDMDLQGLLFFLFAGLFISYVVIRYYLAVKITSRKREIEAQLPDMLDLLSVSVEAGMGFEQAVQHITTNMEGPLIDELTVTFREISMGRTRRDALMLLGERCDVEDVRSFTSALIQASQLGISIKNVLRAQAVAIRQSRKGKVQEKAAKVSTKILLPMLFFIFPVLFIVLLGPAMIKVTGLF